MVINIKVQNFEGPFDLLLHLIKTEKMDIYDIKICEITGQYIEYLKKMKEMDLEVTSEFIVLAATLIEIKSYMLLPKNKNDNDETAADDEDPRKNLVDKLLEYKKFKSAAHYLRTMEDKAGISFGKKGEIIVDKIYNNSEMFKNVTLLDLYNIFDDLIQKYYSKMNVSNILDKKISPDTYKIEDKMGEIIKVVDSKQVVSFDEIACNSQSKIEVIVFFLALLELIKLREVSIVQKDNFEDIFIKEIDKHGENTLQAN